MSLSLAHTGSNAAWPGAVPMSIPANPSDAGNLLIVFAWDWSGTGVTITDTAGDIFTPFYFSASFGQGGTMGCYYAKKTIGNAANVITATIANQSNSYWTLMSAEFTGLDTSSPLDGPATSYGQGNSASMNSGNFSTNWNSELLIACAGWQGYNGVVNSNWSIAVSQEGHSYIAYNVVASTQTNISATGSVPSSGWNIVTQGFVGAGQKPLGSGLLLGVG